MSVLQFGDQAVAAARQVVNQTRGFIVVLPDQSSPQVLALSSGEETVCVESTAAVWAALAPAVWATAEAQPLIRFGIASGFEVPARVGCVRITERLLLGGRPGELTPEAALLRHGLASTGPWGDPDSGVAGLMRNAALLHRLVRAQAEALRRDHLVLVSRLEAAAVAPIAAMEVMGMPFVRAEWEHTLAALAEEERVVRDEIASLLIARGAKVDLFGTLDLTQDAILKRTLLEAGYEVTTLKRSTLSDLPEPLGPLLGRYRELTKVRQSYGLSFLSHVHDDGRIHARYDQIGASTGRMASHSPNLQAVLGDERFRRAFRPEPGRVLVIADYATCELRILAELSGDPVFADAFARGEDLHALVATQMFGKPVSKTENPDLRHAAKVVNFGLVYGMGAAALAQTIKTSQSEAEQLLRQYFLQFPKIRACLQGLVESARRVGFARTLSGRRLYLDSSQAGFDRVAKNMPIQGSSADITKTALGRIWVALRPELRARPVHVVHDEIVVECPEAQAETVRDLVAREMVAAGSQWVRKVPMTVDAAIRPYWSK